MGRSFNTPWIHFNGMSAGDDVVIGGGTGQSTTDPWPCSFEEWETMFCEDYNGDEEFTWEDYVAWWNENSAEYGWEGSPYHETNP